MSGVVSEPGAGTGGVPQTAADAGAAAAGAVELCSVCGEPREAGARYCEACGSEFVAGASASVGTDGAPVVAAGAPAVSGEAVSKRTEPVGPAAPGADVVATEEPSAAVQRCSNCGGAIAGDGYCEECGLPARSERDHWEESLSSTLGGVCDRGIRHAANEDAMALGTVEDGRGSFAALVVCDGVSSTPGSDLASLAAARAARDVLVAARASEPDHGDSRGWSDRERDLAIAFWSESLVAAAARASTSVTDAIGDLAASDNPPSCTFTAVVVVGPLVMTAQIGDSRAYWIPDAGAPRRLTTDDSWAQEMIALGMPRHQAEAAPQAHSITRWMGADSTDEVPRVVPTFPDAAGWVLVCSDGLWNYASAPDEIAGVVRGVIDARGDDPTAISAGLVDWANGRGGHDNITAALARFEPADGAAFGSVDEAAVAAEVSTAPVNVEAPASTPTPTSAEASTPSATARD